MEIWNCNCEGRYGIVILWLHGSREARPSTIKEQLFIIVREKLNMLFQSFYFIVFEFIWKTIALVSIEKESKKNII